MTRSDLSFPPPCLDGRIGVVTGAGRGIGRACALALAAAGVKVIGVSRTATELEALVAVSRGTIQGWQEDVTCDAFYRQLEQLPAIDILVNNAGMNRPQKLEDVDLETLDRMLNLNVRAVYRTSQSAARVMLRNKTSGSIIHMSSQMGHVGAPARSVYCMTKHAVEGLTKALAIELGPNNIRVNSIAPTFIETEFTREMLTDPGFRQSVLDSIPLARFGSPNDVASAVLFLASEGAAMITGASIKVDGGWTAR